METLIKIRLNKEVVQSPADIAKILKLLAANVEQNSLGFTEIKLNDKVVGWWEVCNA